MNQISNKLLNRSLTQLKSVLRIYNTSYHTFWRPEYRALKYALLRGVDMCARKVNAKCKFQIEALLIFIFCGRSAEPPRQRELRFKSSSNETRSAFSSNSRAFGLYGRAFSGPLQALSRGARALIPAHPANVFGPSTHCSAQTASSAAPCSWPALCSEPW
jgi:hypothetical protein